MLGVAGDGVAVGPGVDGLDVDLFGCAPDDLLRRIAICRCERVDRVGDIRRPRGGREIACAVEIDVGEATDGSRLLCARLLRTRLLCFGHAEAPEVFDPAGVDVVSVSKRSFRVATASIPTRSDPSGFACPSDSVAGHSFSGPARSTLPIPAARAAASAAGPSSA
ncbi:Uncharacterised protein [Mycobacteroides abscessus subsp. abscessus]|nr:Uncharacterised protein [Mycobacteroides abscessus subsp. abscessus]